MQDVSNFKIGNSVKVKSNVKDTDFNISIEDWQGRISEIIASDNVVSIKWDSITLQNMPSSIIDECFLMFLR